MKVVRLEEAAMAMIFRFEDAEEAGAIFEEIDLLRSTSLTAWIAESGTGYQIGQAQQKLGAASPKVLSGLLSVIARAKDVYRNRDALKRAYLAAHPEIAAQEKQEAVLQTFGTLMEKVPEQQTVAPQGRVYNKYAPEEFRGDDAVDPSAALEEVMADIPKWAAPDPVSDLLD
jgi:hypothetical protein